MCRTEWRASRVHTELIELSGRRADDELREITQRTVEYRPVKSIKQPKLRRGAIVAIGTLVALSMTACSFAILLKKEEFYARSKFKFNTRIEP
jgi:hypothetical protein